MKNIGIKDWIKKYREVSDIASSSYFDAEWYKNEYHLATSSTRKLAEHYLNEGWRSGYDPSEQFSSVGYLAYNRDVYEAHFNPLLHYVRDGLKEKRPILKSEVYRKKIKEINQSQFFDAEWYRKEYHLDDKQDPVIHYILVGGPAFYNPSPKLSAMSYLIKNQQYIGGEFNPILHYEEEGKNNPNIVITPVDKVVENGRDFEKSYLVDKKRKELLHENKLCEIDRSKYTVDVIICVYNAYEDVKKCLESVLENTDQPYRVIIVDDNSADLTKNYLIKMAEENSHFKLIRNESDLHGYTYAANIGLHAVEADYAVLLNSDTIVPENWLYNMIRCMQSDPGIGIVGPLSNTASWQSVPKLVDDDGDWCHNVIPDGYTITDVASMIERTSKHMYPIVPLLNGFCLMISKDTIQKNGYFDEENFGRGFAEEDDYCSRANKSGIKLAVADDTYIFHAQSKSYSDEKRLKLSKLSGEALRAKHGREYIENACAQMANHHVIDGIRCKVQSYFERENIIADAKRIYNSKKILILLPASNASGGANVIFQEALCWKRMGVETTIVNLKSNKEQYQKSYGHLDFPVIWLSNYAELDEKIVTPFDAVVCTLFKTVQYCTFLKNMTSPKIVYYIQDYEPYFIEERKGLGGYDEQEYQEAVDSYTLISNCINVTKTEWNSNEVQKNTGAKCTVLGASVNVDLFAPRPQNKNKDNLVITAMIRPETLRRGPKMTMEVLRAVAKKYGDLVDIRIFGTDPEQNFKDELFFKSLQLDFSFTNYGLLTPEEMAVLLGGSDIFVDFSTFQAMGLTAMEAMASGCATILPVHGGTGMFAHDEENALVIDTLDFDKNVNALERLISDKTLRDKLAVNGYRSMSKFYPEKPAYKFLKTIFD